VLSVSAPINSLREVLAIHKQKYVKNTTTGNNTMKITAKEAALATFEQAKTNVADVSKVRIAQKALAKIKKMIKKKAPLGAGTIVSYLVDNSIFDFVLANGGGFAARMICPKNKKIMCIADTLMYATTDSMISLANIESVVEKFIGTIFSDGTLDKLMEEEYVEDEDKI
jgi:hypothetical protein